MAGMMGKGAGGAGWTCDLVLYRSDTNWRDAKGEL